MNPMNPMALMKIKSELSKFRENHPKILSFFSVVSSKIEEGAVIDIKVTDVTGQQTAANMKVTKDDIKLLETIRELSNQN